MKIKLKVGSIFRNHFNQVVEVVSVSPKSGYVRAVVLTNGKKYTLNYQSNGTCPGVPQYNFKCWNTLLAILFYAIKKD